MANKITRLTQYLFGASAGANQIAVYGSLAAGSPTTYSGPTMVSSPVLIQGAPSGNYAAGWFNAVVGANSPALEDWNALCFLFAYQLAYILQQGVAEWDAGTTYFINSLVQSGGSLYISLQNSNLNNAVSNGAYWSQFGQGDLAAGSTSLSSNTTLTQNNNGQLVEVNTTSGSFTLTLPVAPAAGFKVHVKDVGYNLSINPLTINGNGKTIEALTSSYTAYANGWERVIYYDGTQYWLT